MMYKIKKVAYRYQRIVKFIISGGTSAVVNLGAFIIFSELFKIWYLSASVGAYIIAFFINFYMQKTWTFQHKEGGTHVQMTMFFANSVLNLVLNTVLMYGMVDIVGIHHIFAQVIVLGVLSVMNYTIYKFFIFRVKPNNNGEEVV